MKKRPTDKEKIFANDVTCKGLVSKFYNSFRFTEKLTKIIHFPYILGSIALLPTVNIA